MLAYLRGIALLLLSKIKYYTSGYTPKPFVRYDERIAYDFKIVDFWLQYAKRLDQDFSLRDKTVLEIGPGSDLGIAAILAAQGMKKYFAYDIHNLVDKVEVDFYEQLVSQIPQIENPSIPSSTGLLNLVNSYSKTGDGVINYICKDCIDFQEIGDGELDVVFSQAAFEHIGDVQGMLDLLAPKCKPGAHLVVEVDLKAHSRWVRDHDPLNIYVYPQWLYDLLSHPATPNRLRPAQYRAILEATGWTDIQILCAEQADAGYVERVKGSLQPRFVDQDLHMLSIMLLARKG